jgi:hypothetical protein
MLGQGLRWQCNRCNPAERRRSIANDESYLPSTDGGPTTTTFDIPRRYPAAAVA